ncbi:hypothetical protein K492DRAFT_191794 [Lichtheimia hyalospora FSU 10163]|nr:hypothetical protein K492DRAFT_191794 [Lichtheimia hyalospora FSU 10163]
MSSSSTSTSPDIDPAHKEEICPLLLELAANDNQVEAQDVIDHLTDYIVE